LRYCPKLAHVFFLCFVLVASQVFPPALAFSAQNPLPDLEGHWAEAELRSLYYQGVINGFPDGKFYPEGPITRAQLAKLVVEARGLGGDATELLNSKSTFSDVPSNHWALGYIEIAAELGIVRGYPGGTFGPEQPIDRDELVVMIVRALDCTLDPSSTADELPYSDREDISSWALPDVVAAYQAGLLEDFAEGVFRPDEIATRAETGVLIRRFLEANSALFDLTGFVTSTSGRVINVSSAGHQLRLSILLEAELFHSGSRISPSSLEPLQEVGMVFDGLGRISYLEVFEQNMVGTVVEIDHFSWTLDIEVDSLGHELAVNPGVRVFRNGRAAALSDVAVGDSVFVISSVFTGEAAYIDATRFDVDGVVSAVDTERSTISVRRGSGEIIAIEISENTLTILNGLVADLDALQPGYEVHVATVEGSPLAAYYVEAYERGQDE